MTSIRCVQRREIKTRRECRERQGEREGEENLENSYMKRRKRRTRMREMRVYDPVEVVLNHLYELWCKQSEAIGTVMPPGT